MSERKKILVIDDDEDICFYLEQLLGKDFDIDLSNNGFQGIEKLKKSDYDLVLLDIMMPEMDGYEVLDIIKKDFPNIQTIFLSAKDTTSDMILGFKKGAARYITKPIDTKELLQEIKTTLKIR